MSCEARSIQLYSPLDRNSSTTAIIDNNVPLVYRHANRQSAKEPL